VLDPVVSDRDAAFGGLLPLTLPMLPRGEPVAEPGGPESMRVALPLVPALPAPASPVVLARSLGLGLVAVTPG